MKQVLHDASKLAFSMLELTISTVGVAKRKVKNCLFNYLSNNGVVSREEFQVFKDMVKSSQEEIENIKKTLSEKDANK